MTEFLLRLFVKGYRDTSDPRVRSEIGKLAGVVGIVCNFLLSGGKLIAGIAAGSVSITADALNNLSDAVASVITLLGFRIAQHPADREHPYGHARFEYISGMIVSVLILVMGIELTKSSVSKILHPESMKIETSAVLVGCIINKLVDVNIDGYVGLAVAIFILYSGIHIAKETVTPLLGKAADADLVKQISDLILSHDKVLGIHDLLLHDYGPGKCYASVHVELSAEENPLVCHDIIDDIEWKIAEQLNVQIVIHYDPIITSDSEWNSLKHRVAEILNEINPAFSMHDFRLVKGADQTKIVFDLVIPYSMNGQQRKLKESIDEKLKSNDICYPTLIRFEGEM